MREADLKTTPDDPRRVSATSPSRLQVPSGPPMQLPHSTPYRATLGSACRFLLGRDVLGCFEGTQGVASD